jgi:glutamate N-acetyltransferase/amino-acid N-acetyltransferase
MASTNLTFTNADEHLAWLATQAVMPRGFRVGTTLLSFVPVEVARPTSMSLVLIVLDRPTADFAAVFTRNAFPGAPVALGRRRLSEETVGAVVVNNKIANVCAPGGEAAAERVCAGVGSILGLTARQVIPSSTGVIGWQLPVEAMLAALPKAAQTLGHTTLVDAAQGIMTTDLYPKVRRVTVGGGSIVGIAKGAGMIEPNMATLLCFICTDVAAPRERLREDLAWCVERTLNRISIDGDQSTSDTVILLSSGRKGPAQPNEFRAALLEVLSGLAFDIVRNGEGIGHVIRVEVSHAQDESTGLGVARAVANSPLVKTAVFGNDPNVGRILSAIGDYMGNAGKELDTRQTTVRMGGEEIFSAGCFRLDAEKERRLCEYLRFRAFDTKRVPWPQHDRTVDIEITLDGAAPAVQILGSDLSYDYVRENADYRS